MFTCVIFALLIEKKCFEFNHFSVAGLVFVCFLINKFTFRLGYMADKNYEHMTDIEAIQNIASMVKDGSLKVNNLDVSGMITTEGLTAKNATMTNLLTVGGDCNVTGNCNITGNHTIAGNLDVGKRITSEKLPVAHQGDKFTIQHHGANNQTCGVRFSKEFTGTCENYNSGNKAVSIVHYNMA